MQRVSPLLLLALSLLPAAQIRAANDEPVIRPSCKEA